MRVWLTACGKTASIASGKPVSPSVQTKSTCLTPRLRRSVSTLVQKRAPSLFSTQKPRQSRSPSNQPLGDLDAVHLAQVPLDVAGRHPAGVESEDLLVEAVEGAAVLGHDPRRSEE